MTDDFERRLADRLAEGLPEAPASLQAKVADMQDKWYREPEVAWWRRLVPVLAPVAVVIAVAVGLVQLGVLGSGTGSPGPSPSPVGTPVPTTFDPTQVVSDGATFSITYEAGNVVVRETGTTGTRVLVSTSAPASLFASPPTSSSVTFYNLACGTSGSADERELVYGYVVGFDRRGGLAYSGPPADGGIADNGLMLFVLRSVADEGERASVLRHGSTPFDPDTVILGWTYEVPAAGSQGVTVLPSGCRQG